MCLRTRRLPKRRLRALNTLSPGATRPACTPRAYSTRASARAVSASAERVGGDAGDLGDHVGGDPRTLSGVEDRVRARRLVEAVGAVPVGAQEREQPAHALVAVD